MIHACKAWSFCTCQTSWDAGRRAQEAWTSTVILERPWGTWHLHGYELSDNVYCLKDFILTLFAVWVAFTCKYFALSYFFFFFSCINNWPHKSVSANTIIFYSIYFLTCFLFEMIYLGNWYTDQEIKTSGDLCVGQSLPNFVTLA